MNTDHTNELWSLKDVVLVISGTYKVICICIFIEAWKAGNPATWKGGEVKLCDGLQVL